MAAQLYIGLMSGTSLDGLDAVVVDLSEQPTLCGHLHQPYPESLQILLHNLIQQHSQATLKSYAEADQLWANFAAATVQQLLAEQQLQPSEIEAIGSHGQTIAHYPEQLIPYTLQLGDPNRLAALTGIPVVADFRRKDIAYGGQGAPLVPAFHAERLGHPDQHRVIINLGGIANITWLPGNSTEVLGFDTGPANTLLDQWFCQHHPDHQDSFDRDGQFARSGTLQPQLLTRLLAEPYFALAPPKSTGRELFHSRWLAQFIGTESAADVQRTLLELTAVSIVNACTEFLPATPQQAYIAGGGAYNSFLLERIQYHFGDKCKVASVAALGVAPHQLEAIAFAWLAQRFIQRRWGNLPAVTGARQQTVLGGLYLP